MKNSVDILKSEQNEHIEHIEIIKWAFEKGYHLAMEDMREGIHISFCEIKRHFLQDLGEFVGSKEPRGITLS